MSIINRFVLGVGYGATAIGFVLMFCSVMMLIVWLAGAVGRFAADDDDGPEDGGGSDDLHRD